MIESSKLLTLKVFFIISENEECLQILVENCVTCMEIIHNLQY